MASDGNLYVNRVNIPYKPGTFQTLADGSGNVDVRQLTDGDTVQTPRIGEPATCQFTLTTDTNIDLDTLISEWKENIANNVVEKIQTQQDGSIKKLVFPNCSLTNSEIVGTTTAVVVFKGDPRRVEIN
jgi:hypothetical protein